MLQRLHVHAGSRLCVVVVIVIVIMRRRGFRQSFHKLNDFYSQRSVLNARFTATSKRSQFYDTLAARLGVRRGDTCFVGGSFLGRSQVGRGTSPGAGGVKVRQQSCGVMMIPLLHRAMTRMRPSCLH